MSIHAPLNAVIPPLLRTLLVHPLEQMRVHSVLNPEAPLVLDSLKRCAGSIATREMLLLANVYSRGLVPHILQFVILGTARVFIAPHIHRFFSKIEPKHDIEDSSASNDGVSAWLWAMAPTIVIQNLLMTLSYPATLATTIAIVPDISGSLGAIDILRLVFQRHGLQGVFAGLLPECMAATLHTLLIGPLCSAVYNKLMTRSMAKISTYNRLDQGYHMQKAQRTNVLLSSAIAHACSCLLLIPFDAVSTQLRLAAGLAGPIPSSFVVAQSLWEKYGPRAFLIGAVPHFLKHSVNAALVTFLLSQQPKQTV